MPEKGKPQRFVGSSSAEAPYEAPPVEIIETASITIGMYIDQLKGAPVFVMDAAKGFVAALDRWADEIKHPEKAPLVLGRQHDIQSLDPIAPAKGGFTVKK